MSVSPCRRASGCPVGGRTVRRQSASADGPHTVSACRRASPRRPSRRRRDRADDGPKQKPARRRPLRKARAARKANSRRGGRSAPPVCWAALWLPQCGSAPRPRTIVAIRTGTRPRARARALRSAECAGVPPGRRVVARPEGGGPPPASCLPHRRFAPPPVLSFSLPTAPAPVPALPASVSGCASRGVRAVQVGPVVVAVVCLHAPGPRVGLDWVASFAVGAAGGLLGEPVSSTLCLSGPGCRSGSFRARASAAAVQLARRIAATVPAASVAPPVGAQLGLGV